MPNLQALAGVPSFGGQLGQALGSGLSEGIGSVLNQFLQQKQQKQQGNALAEYLGQPEMASALGGLPKEIQLEVAKGHFRNQQTKQFEKQNSLTMGLETLEKMKTLIPSAGPSKYLGSLLGGDITRDREELATLGRSLIPLVAAGVPIRNQREFEEYKKVITDPNSRQAKLEGAIKGLQNIFTRALQNQGLSNDGMDEEVTETATIFMRDPSGALRKVSKKDAIKAQKAGYKLEQ